MAAPKVAEITPFSAANDENVIQMMTFLFPWSKHFMGDLFNELGLGVN